MPKPKSEYAERNSNRKGFCVVSKHLSFCNGTCGQSLFIVLDIRYMLTSISM